MQTKSGLKLLFFLPLLLILYSCTFVEIVEIDDRLIITALGIDATDDGYEVTVQALNPSEDSSSQGASKGTSTTQTFCFSGETVGDALIQIYTKTGFKPLYSQARILILGKRAAEEKLSQSLDFFLREYATRTDILLAVSLSTAKEIVSASFGDSVIGAKELENAIKSGKYTSKSVTGPLYKFINLISGETDCAYCPVIGIEKNEFSENMLALVYGTALFYDNKLQAVISDEDTLGLMLLTNQAGGASIPVETPRGTYNLGIVSGKTKISPTINEDTAHFNISTDIKCDIVEYENADFSVISKEDIEIIQEYALPIIEKRLQQTLKIAFYTNNCDICRFGKILMLQDTDFYNKYIAKGDFADKTQYSLDISINVRRVGKESLFTKKNKVQ